MRTIMATRTGSMSEVLSVERELGRLTGEIEQMRGEKRYYDQQVATSTLRLTLREPGEVVSRFRDDVDHTLEPFDMSVDIFGASFAAILSFGVLWSIDPFMTVVVALPVVVVGVVSNRTGAVVRRYRIRARETTEAITGFLGETFTATQSIKVAGAEAKMLQRLGDLNVVRRTMMVRDRTLTAVLEAAFRNTVNIGTGLILLLAAGRLNVAGDAGISIGEFTQAQIDL